MRKLQQALERFDEEQKMLRRTFFMGTCASALQAISAKSLLASPTESTCATQFADTIWQNLPPAKIKELRGLAASLFSKPSRPTPPELQEMVAADFRSGLTLLVKRVRFSRTEIAWYLRRDGYL